MNDWVLDASVVIKWFVPEALSTEARRWRRIRGVLHAPSLLDTELANILWKKVGRNDVSQSQADRILARAARLPLTRHADTALLKSAFDMACQTRRRCTTRFISHWPCAWVANW